jgi:hypothetical protein
VNGKQGETNNYGDRDRVRKGGFVIGEFQGTEEVSGAQGEEDVEGDMMQALVALNATQMMGDREMGTQVCVHRLTWTSKCKHTILTR